MAVFATLCCDYATARAEADEGLRLARQVGNPSTSATALWASGRALIRADPSAALVAFEEYVVLARGGAKSANLGSSLGDVGWLKARSGDRVGALRALRDGVRHDLRSGNHSMLVMTLRRTQLALVELEHPEPAAVLAGAETKGPLAAWNHYAGVDDEELDQEHALSAIQASLGPDAFKRAFARGAAMTFDGVVEYTLGQLQRLLIDAEGE